MAREEAAVTSCPYCGEAGTRQEVHLHLVGAHGHELETWTDAETGRMHYRIACPVCGDAYEHRVKPRSRDTSFLERFAHEIRMVGFDMLLNHVEAAHDPSAGEAARDAEPAALPEAGPGGGRGRPGTAGVPLPPGMEAEAPGIPGHPRPPAMQIHRRAAADSDPSTPKED